MTQTTVAIGILATAGFLMLLGYNFPRNRMFLMSVGFFTLMSGAFASYSNWLPQTRGEVPEAPKLTGDISELPVDKLAEFGESVIFGKVGGFDERGIGKGQCPLCHSFKAGDIGDRAPNLIGIGVRAEERIKENSYLNPNTVQTVSFEGSGRATRAAEYIAESHACPSCYVVPGFGVKGTNDRESPMPAVHKPPIALSIDELVAVDTWMFYREGMEPPTVDELRAAYEKFIPEGERIKAAAPGEEAAPTGIDPKKIAMPEDDPALMVQKMACFACHRIPTVAGASTGVIGPLLIEGTNAKLRIASAEYKAAVKAGKASARTPKAYVIESIMDPGAFIVPGFPILPGGKSLMPADFANKFTYAAVSKLADFLLSLDAEAAIKENLDRVPMEKEGSLLKKASATDKEDEIVRGEVVARR